MISTSHHVPLRIVVLAGGDSAERDVSLKSGAGVAAALAATGHRVALVDPAEHPLSELDPAELDACFIALHGGAGEDGRVQAELARLGIAYTGSTSECCRLAMSKSASKERFLERRVPTPPSVVIEPGDSPADVARRVAALGYPLVVKPDGQGSSIGIAIAAAPADLERAIRTARAYDRTCLAEPLVSGREFTVALVDDRPLPMIEIVTPEPVFSYQAKYHSALTEYRFDIELADASRAAIIEAAIGAARALETTGLVRVDLILSDDARVWVLELNTVPGMTPRSLAPQAAARAGIDMTALCDQLVRQCFEAVSEPLGTVPILRRAPSAGWSRSKMGLSPSPQRFRNGFK